MVFNFSNPENNIKFLSLKEGDVVADFGSGVGHYVLPISEEVGESGKVYAVDIQKDLLAKLNKECTERHLTNIEMVWGNVEKVGGSKLRNGSLDVLVASNILFQVEDKKSFVKECSRTLKNGGKLLVVDWSESFGGIGPQTKDVVSENFAEEIFTSEGFLLKESIPAGAHHYGLLFIKQ